MATATRGGRPRAGRCTPTSEALRTTLRVREGDMEWDNGREVGIDRGGYAYDASHFGVGTRSGSSERRRNGDA